MHTSATVGAPYINSLIGVAAECSLNIKKIFFDLGVNVDLLNNPGARLPFTTFLEAWHSAMASSGKPCLGFRAGQLFNPSAYGPLACVMLTSPSLGEAATQIIRFGHIIDTGTSCSLGVEGDLAYMELNAEGYSDEFVRPEVEFSLSKPSAIAKFLTPPDCHQGISPVEIWFKHQQAADIASYKEILDVPIKFGQSKNRLYFRKSVLSLPTCFSDISLFRNVVNHLESNHLEQSRSFVREVRYLIMQQLPEGLPNMHDVADSFHMSYRTFQRRLEEENCKFTDIVTEVRKEMAVKHLKEKDTPINEITYMLGFNERSAFYKAFRRWMGVSPGEFRKRCSYHHVQSPNPPIQLLSSVG